MHSLFCFYKSTCVFWIMKNERNGVMHHWWYIHDWHTNFMESTEKMYKTIPFLFWCVFNASVWSSIIFCVTSLGTGKAGPPPVWLRLFLFTAASTFAVEQTFLHFSLIWSTYFVCPPALALIHKVCDLFPHFCLLCICYDIRLFWSNYGYAFLHKLT